MDVTVVQNLILATATAVITLLVFFLKGLISLGLKYLETKIGTERLVQLKGYASTVVRSLEQSPAFQDLTGEHKKEMAIAWMLDMANKANLPVTEEMCDQLIEEAVQMMNMDELLEVGS